MRHLARRPPPETSDSERRLRPNECFDAGSRPSCWSEGESLAFHALGGAADGGQPRGRQDLGENDLHLEFREACPHAPPDPAAERAPGAGSCGRIEEALRSEL